MRVLKRGLTAVFVMAAHLCVLGTQAAGQSTANVGREYPTLVRHAVSRYQEKVQDAKSQWSPWKTILLGAVQSYGQLQGEILVAFFPAEWLFVDEVIQPLAERGCLPSDVHEFQPAGNRAPTIAVHLQYGGALCPVKEDLQPVSHDLALVNVMPLLGKHAAGVSMARHSCPDTKETKATLFIKRVVRDRKEDNLGELTVFQVFVLRKGKGKRLFEWHCQGSVHQFVPISTDDSSDGGLEAPDPLGTSTNSAVTTVSVESDSDPHSWDSADLYHRLDWSLADIAEEVAASITLGDVSKKEMFSLLVDAIRKQDDVPAHYEECARLLSSVCPDDTAVLIDGLAIEAGPGHAYTNLVIAQLLLDKRTSVEDKDRMCQALSLIYGDWGKPRRPDGYFSWPPHYGHYRSTMALEGIKILARIGRLSAEGYEPLLGVLNINGKTHGGQWLAAVLCKQMPDEVAAHHIETILDILEKPPKDNSRLHPVPLFAKVHDRIPGVLGPREWLRVSEMPPGGKLLEPEEKNFLEWCNKACDPAWPTTMTEAMLALVVKAGDTGLAAVYERLADPSKSTRTKLQLLACAAGIAPDSPRVTRVLMDVLNGEKEPDWMLAGEVMRSVNLTKEETSRLQAAWQSWRERRKHKGVFREGDYRFLFAISASDDGIRLLEGALPEIEKLAASPPFYMFFLEDVPYGPKKYEPVLERLLKANVWWHRCAAIVMLYRYTDYFDAHPNTLERIAKNDQQPFTRELCRQIQEREMR